jgi:hypothetical protein
MDANGENYSKANVENQGKINPKVCITVRYKVHDQALWVNFSLIFNIRLRIIFSVCIHLDTHDKTGSVAITGSLCCFQTAS